MLSLLHGLLVRVLGHVRDLLFYEGDYLDSWDYAARGGFLETGRGHCLSRGEDRVAELIYEAGVGKEVGPRVTDHSCRSTQDGFLCVFFGSAVDGNRFE